MLRCSNCSQGLMLLALVTICCSGVQGAAQANVPPAWWNKGYRSVTSFFAAFYYRLVGF
jgi:hypothetical protein